MLIFSGHGYFVAIIVVGMLLIAQQTTIIFAGNDEFWRTHSWPTSVAMWGSAVVCFFLGRELRRRHVTVVLASLQDEDESMFLTKTVRESHTFFFIPVIWWGPILVLAGFIYLFKK